MLWSTPKLKSGGFEWTSPPAKLTPLYEDETTSVTPAPASALDFNKVTSITPPRPATRPPITPMGRWRKDIFSSVVKLAENVTNPYPKSVDWNSQEMTPMKIKSEKLGATKWNSVPKLSEIRNLPHRHQYLELCEEDSSILSATNDNRCSWAIKPSPPLCPDMHPKENSEKSVQKKPTRVLLTPDTNDDDAAITWVVDDHWIAKKYERRNSPVCMWNLMEEYNLSKSRKPVGRSVPPSEWSARFNRREKQIQVGKNTEGYQGLMKFREKHGRNHGEPQTPRVAELSSKRQFDGRLSHWRILLHAFSCHNLT